MDMGATSPLDLFWITLAVGIAYAAIAWRFFVVPAQRRRTIVVEHRRHNVTRVGTARPITATQAANVRPHLTLVHSTSSQR
jgi:predicted permease